MRRASDLMGLPVMDVHSSLGTVKDLLVDFDRSRLGALLLTGRNQTESGVIPAEDVVFGPDALNAPANAILRGEGAVIYRQGKLTLEKARQLTVEDTAGCKLGKVADLVLEGARLVALELSDGLLQDIFEGRKVLFAPFSADLAQDKLIASGHSPRGDGNGG